METGYVNTEPSLSEKEHITPSPEFSRRILSAPSKKEALNPNTPLTSVTRESLGIFAERDYTIFNTKSDQERETYWKTQPETDNPAQMAKWLKDTQADFADNQAFFSTTEEGKQWTNVFSHLGLSADNMTQTQLEQFYATYLASSDKANGGEKKFIADILSSPMYQTPDGKFDDAKLREDLPALEWLANVFGENSAQIASRLSSSEATLQQAPDAIITPADTMMSAKEIKLLEFLSEDHHETPYGERTAQQTDTDSVLDQTAAPIKQAEENDTPEVAVEKRVVDQKNYIDRVRNRYTTKRLAEVVHAARTGENPDGTKLSKDEFQKARREAIRVQSFLYALNATPKDYVAELETVNVTLPPMTKDVEFSVVIPAYREQDRIKRTLESWINQTDDAGSPIDPSRLEILILINKPNDTRGFDETAKAIEEFKLEHPAYAAQIHAVEKTFHFENTKKRLPDGKEIETPDVSMGLIYRYATDLALLRNLGRDGQNKERIANHVIRTGGADVVARSPHHVERILSSFQASPALEQYVSLSDYDPKIYRKIPLLFLARNIHETMNDYLTQGFSNIGLGTYRAALYGEAGGFEPRAKIAEEIELSQRMRTILKANGEDLAEARKRDMVLNAIDDPKRDVAAIFFGQPITSAYDDYDVNEAIRTMNMDDVLAAPLPPTAELTLPNINTQAGAILRFYMREFFDPLHGALEPTSTDTTINYFKQALTAVGISPEHATITFDGAPYTHDSFAEILKNDTEGIDKLRSRFSVSINTLPQTETLMNTMEKQFKDRKGDWALTLQ